MEFSKGSLTVFDYTILAAVLILSSCIGVYYHFVDRRKPHGEYFLASRSMPIAPVAFSLMASFLSAVTILGLTAEHYMHGTQFVMINIGYVFGMPVATFVILPVFFNMQAASAFEYLEKRFCKTARLLASSVFIIQVIIYMSIILYAPAIALNAVTGVSKWTSVFLIGVVCTVYSTLGGIKAVLWTDLFQALLMFSAIFAVTIKGTMDVGGLSEVLRIAKEGERIQFFNFDPDPTVRHTFWTLVIGGFFTYLAVHAVNQAQVQRLLTVRSLKKSQIATGLNVVLIIIFKISLCFAGTVIYANLSKCDPLLRSSETSIHKADQILPYFVMTSLTSLPGLPGLFVAGVFSACLSSVSSAINSLAAVTVEDFLYPLYFHHFSEKRITIFTKLTAFIYGIICISLTIVIDQVGGIYQFGLMLFNVVGGPMLGIFSLGMLCRKTTAKGAITGFVVSFCLSSTIGIIGMIAGHKTPSYYRSTEGCPSNDSFPVSVHSIPEYINQTIIGNWTSPQHLVAQQEYISPLLRLSYMWYAGFGFSVCFIVGICTSFVWGKQKYVDPKLLSPITRLWIPQTDHLPE
ncbi:putative sodium-dependent multivitamin transporter, partial [Nephila pilipes]